MGAAAGIEGRLSEVVPEASEGSLADAMERAEGARGVGGRGAGAAVAVVEGGGGGRAAALAEPRQRGQKAHQARPVSGELE